MAWLAARLTARRAIQALGRRRLGETVRGQRPERTPRVLRRPPLQLCDLGTQLNEPALQATDRRYLPKRKCREIVTGPANRGDTTSIALKPAATPRPEQAPESGMTSRRALTKGRGGIH